MQLISAMFSGLSALILWPLLGAVLVLAIPGSRIRLIRSVGFGISLICFVYSLLFWIRFDNSTPHFQFVETIHWLPYSNINFYIGLDGISLLFVILTTFLVPICILVGWSNIKLYKKEYIIAFLVLESFMIAVFCMLDLLLFYVFFESVLIPMLCGAEHPVFVGALNLAGALCNKPLWADRKIVGPVKLPEKGSLSCKCSDSARTRTIAYVELGKASKRGLRESSPQLHEYRINIRERELLIGATRKKAVRTHSSFLSTDTIARIAGDGHKGGEYRYDALRPGMNVNSLTTAQYGRVDWDNHSGPFSRHKLEIFFKHLNKLFFKHHNATDRSTKRYASTQVQIPQDQSKTRNRKEWGFSLRGGSLSTVMAAAMRKEVADSNLYECQPPLFPLRPSPRARVNPWRGGCGNHSGKAATSPTSCHLFHFVPPLFYYVPTLLLRSHRFSKASVLAKCNSAAKGFVQPHLAESQYKAEPFPQDLILFYGGDHTNGSQSLVSKQNGKYGNVLVTLTDARLLLTAYKHVHSKLGKMRDQVGGTKSWFDKAAQRLFVKGHSQEVPGPISALKGAEWKQKRGSDSLSLKKHSRFFTQRASETELKQTGSNKHLGGHEVFLSGQTSVNAVCMHRRFKVLASRVLIIRTAFRMVLELLYERQFLNTSHAFRPGRGSHSALQQVKTHWCGVSWFLELDLKNQDALGSVELNSLLVRMREHIKDPAFLHLLHQLLSSEWLNFYPGASQMCTFDIEKFRNGVPENRAFPIVTSSRSTLGCKPSSLYGKRSGLPGLLCNIYYHTLDLEVDKIRSDFETNRNIRGINPEYLGILKQNVRRIQALDKHTRWAVWLGRKRLARRLGLMPTDYNDTRFIRVRYVRHGEKVLVGIAGSAALVNHIRDRLTAFLQSKVPWPIGLAKYTHINSDKVMFLGVQIHGCSKQLRKRSNPLEKQRRVNKRIRQKAAQRRSAIYTKLAKHSTKVLAAQLKKLKSFGGVRCFKGAKREPLQTCNLCTARQSACGRHVIHSGSSQPPLQALKKRWGNPWRGGCAHHSGKARSEEVAVHQNGQTATSFFTAMRKEVADSNHYECQPPLFPLRPSPTSSEKRGGCLSIKMNSHLSTSCHLFFYRLESECIAASTVYSGLPLATICSGTTSNVGTSKQPAAFYVGSNEEGCPNTVPQKRATVPVWREALLAIPSQRPDFKPASQEASKHELGCEAETLFPSESASKAVLRVCRNKHAESREAYTNSSYLTETNELCHECVCKPNLCMRLFGSDQNESKRPSCWFLSRFGVTPLPESTAKWQQAEQNRQEPNYGAVTPYLQALSRKADWFQKVRTHSARGTKCRHVGNKRIEPRVYTTHAGRALTQKDTAFTNNAHHDFRVLLPLGTLRLSAPVNTILQQLREGGIITRKKARPAHVAPLSNASDEAIVQYFARIARGLLNYYRCCDNLSRVKAIVDYQIRWSALFTLANKHKTSAREIIQKLSRNMNIVDANGKTLAQYVGHAELKSIRPVFLLSQNPSQTILDRVKPLCVSTRNPLGGR
jgi:Type II intron maturase